MQIYVRFLDFARTYRTSERHNNSRGPTIGYEPIPSTLSPTLSLEGRGGKWDTLYTYD